MRAKEFILLSEAVKKKGTCPKCSDGHKNGNFFTLDMDYGFDRPDYDENAPPKMFWVCNNCGFKVPKKKKAKTAAQQARDERLRATFNSLIGEDEQIDELAFDDQNGKGITPNNLEIDHIGMRVLMTPENFLRLAQPLIMSPKHEEQIKAMAAADVKFAPPFLKIKVPNEWKAFDQPPEVRFKIPGTIIEHEGRHRMYAHQLDAGETPVEVHIILQSPNKEWRTRNWANDNRNDYSPEVITALNTRLRSEMGVMLQGPFFHYESPYE